MIEDERDENTSFLIEERKSTSTLKPLNFRLHWKLFRGNWSCICHERWKGTPPGLDNHGRTAHITTNRWLLHWNQPTAKWGRENVLFALRKWSSCRKSPLRTSDFGLLFLKEESSVPQPLCGSSRPPGGCKLRHRIRGHFYWPALAVDCYDTVWMNIIIKM